MRGRSNRQREGDYHLLEIPGKIYVEGRSSVKVTGVKSERDLVMTYEMDRRLHKTQYYVPQYKLEDDLTHETLLFKHTTSRNVDVFVKYASSVSCFTIK